MEKKEELLKVAEGRLHPSLTHHSYLVLRKRTQLIRKWVERLQGNSLRVLEVGGRYQPYRSLIQLRASQYIALDIQRTPLVDVVGDGDHLPFHEGWFDLVIATQVLEYFPEPRKTLQEIHSVLRPGGIVIASVASIAPVSSGYEYWRFLPAGIRYAFSDFTQVEIIPELSSVGSFFRYLNWSLSVFCRYEAIRTIYSYTLSPLINVVGVVLEGLNTTRNQDLTGNYSIFAMKSRA